MHLHDVVRGHDPALDAPGAPSGEVGITVDDVGAELAAYAAGVELDPSRLAAVHERRAALAALQRKYGPTSTTSCAWADDER